MCKHEGPRHLIERFDTGKAEEFWMCCVCGEAIGRYQRQNTRGCEFIPNKHHWVRPKTGKIISEYAPL